ncbi:sigma factor-like helix-turn-helix DNA-binding protein [Streptomyces atroolivaceus]|uniref:sigma factor-like helix-turn-helix DNA-binding protein n=1 Tax=Streptomyces atroolivaceus TaxID=66869 RepID=UPI0009964C5A|nr:sigma factor-like helix-turn-helix DNA-binding protein [Streptomyces atroolivaceus]
MTRSITGPAPAAPLPSPKERRRLREARALSEEDVARVVGVTPATVRSWEKGRTSPRGRLRAAYAKLLGCAGHPSAPNPSAPPPSAPPPSAPPPSVDVPRSSTTPPTAPATDPGTGPAVGTRTAPEPEPAPPKGPGLVPRARESLTSEEAFDVLYSRTAPGLTRQVFLLTGRRTLSREAVEHAFRIAWQRWPEVVRDRDPAGWVRAAAYEYAMSPWHRLRPAHRRADPLPGDPARGALLDALLGLPPSYRRTLLLHDGVGLGLPETAAETEASTPAAASRLVNARTAVVEQVPGLVESPGPGGRSVVLHERLRALALAEDVPAPPSAPAVRAGGERIAELWTRAALCFGVLLISSTASPRNGAGPPPYDQGGRPPPFSSPHPPRGGGGEKNGRAPPPWL